MVASPTIPDVALIQKTMTILATLKKQIWKCRKINKEKIRTFKKLRIYLFLENLGLFKKSCTNPFSIYYQFIMRNAVSHTLKSGIKNTLITLIVGLEITFRNLHFCSFNLYFSFTIEHHKTVLVCKDPLSPARGTRRKTIRKKRIFCTTMMLKRFTLHVPCVSWPESICQTMNTLLQQGRN